MNPRSGALGVLARVLCLLAVLTGCAGKQSTTTGSPVTEGDSPSPSSSDPRPVSRSTPTTRSCWGQSCDPTPRGPGRGDAVTRPSRIRPRQAADVAVVDLPSPRRDTHTGHRGAGRAQDRVSMPASESRNTTLWNPMFSPAATTCSHSHAATSPTSPTRPILSPRAGPTQWRTRPGQAVRQLATRARECRRSRRRRARVDSAARRGHEAARPARRR
jgi:hypothetical protein